MKRNQCSSVLVMIRSISNGNRQKSTASLSSATFRQQQTIMKKPSKSTTARTLLAEESSSSSASSSTTAGRNILPLDWVLSPKVVNALPLIGNVSYMALASGFLMTDMLELRVLLVGGYTGLVAFHMLHPRPLRIPLKWSALFVLVNAGAAALLLADQYASLSADDEELYVEHFSQSLTRGQFYQLLQLGERKDNIPANEVLTIEGASCENIYFILEGSAKVYHHKACVSNIKKGGFVNDVAFQQGDRQTGAYGTVVTSSENTSLIVWNQYRLRDYLKSRPDMERNMKYCLSDQLVKSLLHQREASRQRQLSNGEKKNINQHQLLLLNRRNTNVNNVQIRRSPSEERIISWEETDATASSSSSSPITATSSTKS